MASNIPEEDDSRNELLNFSAVELQQKYYEAIGDADWELYEKKDRKYLLQKIAVALCGPPKREGNLLDNRNCLKLEGYELRDEEITMKVFNKICEKAKYSHNSENILISILQVICVIPKEDVPFYKFEPSNYWVDLHLKRRDEVVICVFHVFCVRKCISTKPGAKCCRIYIDHDGRVYNDWTSYLTENNLPKSVMIVPENGEYKGVFVQENTENTNGNIPMVKLSVLPSPALGLGARVLSVMDTANTVASLGAVAGIVGAIALPAVAPVALGAATGVAVVTGVYGIVRSTIHLADRKKHEQSIGLQDSQARSSWINIVMSTVGISCSAAGKLLSAAAASGTNVKILMNAVQFLKYTNIVTGFVGVVNGLGEMIYKYYKYQESPSNLELFQFSCSLLFFGIGVMSNQTAKDIVQDAQANTINEVRDNLSSNTKRKIFDKVTAETRRLEGTIKGNADVIKALKTIENKDDFFAKLNRINKQVNKNKVRISLSSDGSPLINNQHKIGISQLYGLGKDGRNQLFSEFGPAKITTRNVPTRIYPSASTVSARESVETDIKSYIRPEEIIKITNFLIQLSQSDQEMVDEILSELTYRLHDTFLLLCAELLASLVSNEICLLASIGPDHKIRFILFVFDYIKLKFRDFDNEDEDSLLESALKQFLFKGGIDQETIRKMRKELIKWIKGQKLNNDPSKFNDIHNFRRKYKKRFQTLQAGQIIEAGEHKIIVKTVTVEKLEGWLETYSQENCDLFIEFCLKIISMMSATEIDTLNLMNPDEDVIMRVANFLFNGHLTDIFLSNFSEQGEVDISVALCVKYNIMDWRSTQKVRKHKKCSLCKGIEYE